MNQRPLTPKERQSLEEAVRQGLTLLYKERQARSFNLEAFCAEPQSGRFFQKQFDFITDKAKFKVACNSRRSGKTLACCGDLVAAALSRDGVSCAYITLSRLNAKQILWRELLGLLKRYSIEHKPNEQELYVRLRNDSLIYLFGAKDESEIEKVRGKAFAKVYIDEAQAFRPYLRQLIFDILSAALFDYDGSLALIGTPGPAKVGVFFEACHGMPGFTGFSQHHWTLFDNPFLEAKAGKTAQQIVAEDLALKGLTMDSPWVQREILGNWVEDTESLVYKFDANRNTYEALPDGPEWRYVLGVDIGFDDPDAIVVWAFHPGAQEVYLVEEYQKEKSTITDLAEAIRSFNARYRPVSQVIDTGGLGKKITEELRQRYGLTLEPADKTQKHAFIELMNDDLRTGKIRVPASAKIAQEWRILCWDLDYNPPREDDRAANHRPDAALYSWRECKRLLKRDLPKPKLDIQSQVEQYWTKQKTRHVGPNTKEWWE